MVRFAAPNAILLLKVRFAVSEESGTALLRAPSWKSPPIVMLLYLPVKSFEPLLVLPEPELGPVIVPPLMVSEPGVALPPIAFTPRATRVPEFNTKPPPNVPPEDAKVPGPVKLKPTVEPVDHACPPASKVFPLLTVIGLTAPAVPPSVPDAEVIVKFSVALIPPTVIVPPVPVPFTVAKFATLPDVKDDVNGPAAVEPHLAVASPLPSPAKNWSAAKTI
jgi:hypothetical protein